jgi:2',3'-cyclic-nucleotide 2'-phosphodiesterase/3'-nucleotidase
MSPSRRPQSSTPPEILLKVLATTDLHGVLGGEAAPGGLARITGKISSLRRQNANVLVFDNGDFLQGTALCDLIAEGLLDPDKSHPVLQAMTHISFDAINLGNHEFDYGLAFLSRVLAQTQLPVISSNISIAAQPWAADTMLSRSVKAVDGTQHSLKIGVFGLLPTQVMEWSRQHLAHQATVADMRDTAKLKIAELKARGADLVIALCHAGLTAGSKFASNANTASAIRDLPGLNAVVCGHTHEVIPASGTETHHKEECPVVLPGVDGQHLGQIDLRVRQTNQGWVSTARASCIALDQNDPEDPTITALAKPWLTKARKALSGAIGKTQVVLHNEFWQIHCPPSVRLAAAAKLSAARSTITKTGLGSLPLLAAASPLGAQDVPSCVNLGKVTLGDLYGLYPYLNAMDGLLLRGAQIKDWLEQAASGFHFDPDTARLSWPNSTPPYDFDSILGLSYVIDPTRTIGARVSQLRFQGKPLRTDQRVVLLTNSFRGGGGGAFPHDLAIEQIDIPHLDVRRAIGELCVSGLSAQDLPPDPWRLQWQDGLGLRFSARSSAFPHLPNDLKARLTVLSPPKSETCEYLLGRAQQPVLQSAPGSHK